MERETRVRKGRGKKKKPGGVGGTKGYRRGLARA